MKYYLAVDIGASSGRHMLGWVENGVLVTEEIHRFQNGMVKKGGELCWDIEALFDEVIHGLKRCAAIGKLPESIGIDTWGVDFVLLDENDCILGNTVAYRDSRTDGMDAEVSRLISETDLYGKTGIQKQTFNTIYQLMSLKKNKGQLLDEAKTMLMIPDYLHYRLSGIAKTEYTNATTTGLVNVQTKNWDDSIIQACGVPRQIFADIVTPGTALGSLTDEVQRQVGFNCKVVLPATHDTGSAVMAVPMRDDNAIYISSGTWSLMGIEAAEPNCSEEARSQNFTNEGGYDFQFRFLKNIMGLWMIQSVSRELGGIYSFAELCELAEKERISSIVNCNDNRFLSPESMIGEIQRACIESNQPVPEEAGELAAVVYCSLAACYKKTADQIEALTGKTYSTINIVGGGANAEYLNKLTAIHTGKTAYAGPDEATALGNLAAQMIADGVFEDIQGFRECIGYSFEIREFGA